MSPIFLIEKTILEDHLQPMRSFVSIDKEIGKHQQ